MGMSSTAILFWGLCGDEEEGHWSNIGLNYEDTDYIKLPEDEDGDEEWENVYVSRKGHPNAEWDTKKELIEKSGCTICTHCSFDYGMPYVAIEKSEVRNYQGNLTEIKTLEVQPDWEQKLRKFCEVMGIKWSEPKWWLVSLYG